MRALAFVLVGAAAVHGLVRTGRTFRVVAKDLGDGSYTALAGQWRVFSLRFYSDEGCSTALGASVIADAAVTVSKTYVVSNSPLSSCEGPFGVICSDPRDPLSAGATPAVAVRSWTGFPAAGLEADGAWIQLEFAADTAVGCVKLFQDPYQTAGTLSLEVPGSSGEFELVTSEAGRACPADAPTACCACAEGATRGCDWDCPAVVTLRTGPHPPPSPPPTGADALELNSLDSGDWGVLIPLIVLACLLLLLCCCCLFYARRRGWIGEEKRESNGDASESAQIFVVASRSKQQRGTTQADLRVETSQPAPYSADHDRGSTPRLMEERRSTDILLATVLDSPIPGEPGPSAPYAELDAELAMPPAGAAGASVVIVDRI